MSLVDYQLSDSDPTTILSEPIRGGYRLRAAPRHAVAQIATRSALALVIFSLIAAGGMVWTLSDASFSVHEPALVKALLSSSLYIVAAAIFLGSSVSKLPKYVDVDLKNRVLRLAEGNLRTKSRAIRFEEIVRLENRDGGRMADLNFLMARVDHGRITAQIAGGKTVELIGGDVLELDAIAHQLRGEIAIA